MDNLTLRAHAKVNYSLDVLGVRADGYHEVATVLQSISLFDELRVERCAEGLELTIEPGDFDCGPPEKNTVRVAWRLLSEAVGRELPVRVHLRKHIPSGSGLGGASADAAAVLVALERLYGLGMGEEGLREVAAGVGADVPFCVGGGTALGEGVGARLTALCSPPPHALVVARPARAAGTAEVYRTHDALEQGARRHASADVIEALCLKDPGALGQAVGNQLGEAAVSVVPEIDRYRVALSKAGALGVCVSGSGSAVYGVFSSKGAAERALGGIEAYFAGAFEPVGCSVEVV